MFEKITPEAAGISSRSVNKFIHFLEDSGLSMHSVLLARGNGLFAEYYWKPFDKDFCHRMYSQTKSFVAIAIGLLEEEGKLNLDDPIVLYFPDKLDGEIHPYMQEQTIRDMLTMTTCVNAPFWFETKDPDRTHEYLNCKNIVRLSGTVWEYDSPGSQVLSSLVERLSGKSLLKYLNEKIFCHLNAFHTAQMLKTPNGDSWGDSGLLCTSRDMLAFARFVMNYGVWQGKRLMNEEFLKKATSAVVDNSSTAFDRCNEMGYGYQIWRHNMNGFGFFGMGNQYTICVPEKDLIFVCTADNQGYVAAQHLIFHALKTFIVSEMGAPLTDDPTEFDCLESYGTKLQLVACKGSKESVLSSHLHNKIFRCMENCAGIKWFSFDFGETDLIWKYENEQGIKQLKCGLCHNEFEKFPQYGYSNEYGGCITTDGFLYNCAVSAAWKNESQLSIRVQIIDRYFGNLWVLFAFKEARCCVKMVKNAENFLNEYQGEFIADMEVL